MFAYYSLPMMIHTIQDDKHPVKIGLSDAYIIDKTIFCKYYGSTKLWQCSNQQTIYLQSLAAKPYTSIIESILKVKTFRITQLSH